MERVILDDGDYYVDLNVNHDPAEAPGFLQRRCHRTAVTPGGYECVGSFDRLPGGAWQASISAPYDSTTDSDARVVGEFPDRINALVALWRARHGAFCRHHF